MCTHAESINSQHGTLGLRRMRIASFLIEFNDHSFRYLHKVHHMYTAYVLRYLSVLTRFPQRRMLLIHLSTHHRALGYTHVRSGTRRREVLQQMGPASVCSTTRFEVMLTTVVGLKSLRNGRGRHRDFECFQWTEECHHGQHHLRWWYTSIRMRTHTRRISKSSDDHLQK